MRKPSVPALPLGRLFSLNIKCSPDAILLNINIERSSFHWDDVVGSIFPGSPVVVELRVNMMMLVMKWIPQQKVVNLIDFSLQHIPDRGLSHYIIKHLSQVILVIFCCIRWVDSFDVERLPRVFIPCHLIGIKKVVAVRWTVLDCDLLGKRYHVW